MTSKKLATKSPSRSTAKTVVEYFEDLPKESRAVLSKLRTIVRSAAPPKSTEIISYKIPALKHGTTTVWYAAFSHHVSLFPGGSIIKQFEDDLKRYSTAKGTIQFPLDKPLPQTLIKKLVKARFAQGK